MPTARIKFDNFGDLSGRDTLELLGPTLPVHIGYDRAFQPGDLDAPKLPEAYWPALVDSGAFECCIDSSLAIQLGLPIVEKDTIVGVYGSFEVPFHLAQIHIPELSWTIYGKFCGCSPCLHWAASHGSAGQKFPSTLHDDIRRPFRGCDHQQ